MPDFMGEGELAIMAASGLAVSGVKLTCLTILTLLARRGVVGVEGNDILMSALLALLLTVGMDDGGGGGFLELLGYRRMDLTFCRVPGLRRKFLEMDFGVLLRLGVVDDFVKVRGVLFKAGLDGDRDKVGI